MISYETFCQIRHLRDRDGLNRAQIAEELSLDLRTVGKWLDEKQFRPRKKSDRASKLDPFKSTIIKMIETHPYSAKQIFQRIQEEGFSGGYTIVRDYVSKMRPKRSAAYLKLAFAPGECAQVDWGSFGVITTGETRRRLSFFVMVMCYSRMMYLEFTVSQTMEHWLGCHQNALRFFGGVPKKIMVDNLKSAVIKRTIGQAPVFNQRYLDFANHHGFVIVPCGVAKGNEKGRVESGVGYVKKNFLNGLTMPSLEALQRAGREWLDNTANQRIHGETRKKPVEMFVEERLNLLPVQKYDCAAIMPLRASSQFRISLDSNRYSVPAEYANCKLTGKIYPDRICIYDQEKLIARHRRSYDRHQDFENPDHPKALLAQRRKAHNQQILKRFLTISPKAQIFYQKLEDRRMNPITHIRKIVALSEIYGPEAVSRAINDALVFAAFSSEYIANLLEQRTRDKTEPAALHLSRKEDLLEIEVDEPNLEIYT
ncbi:MAG: IS21 family transposase, partial [Bacteroidetes bacterium]